MTDGETARQQDGETGRPNAPGAPLDPSTPADAPMAADAANGAPSRSPAIAPSEVLAWLDARESPPPAELRAHIARALEGVRAETVPGALAEAALACLQATLAAPQARETALDLLTADALLTYALEAAAELGASTLREMVELYGPGALAPLVPPEEAGASGGLAPGALTAPGGSPVPPEGPEPPGSPAPEATP